MMSEEQQVYDKIVKANKEYRQGTPIMSDQEYDRLIEKLKKINPDHEWFKCIEPGMDVPEGRKVKLPYPMRSLDKVKTLSELQKWFLSVGLKSDDEVVVTPKYDGISILCNERSLKAYSRGGAENEGLDCKSHMEAMDFVYHAYNSPIEYTFGEAIIARNVWENHFKGKINPLNGEVFKSPRNTVAGFFRRDNPPVELLKYVQFFRYGAFGEGANDVKTYLDLLHLMQKVFRYSSSRCLLKISEISEEKLQLCFDEWSFHTAIDGLVLYVNDMSRWKSIGRHSSTGNPQWAIAYKPEEFTCAEITIVQSVNCKVAKSGYLKPTVAVEAVELEGATIDNPTGYNANFCFDRGIGTGAEIKIIRSGMVIPKIVDVIYPVSNDVVEKAFKYCPSCGKETVWNESHVERMCPDVNCPGRLLAKLVYFCEKLKYDDIGEETLKAIFNAGIKTPGELLHADLPELQKINGIGYDTASKIIERNRSIFDDGVPLPKLMEVSDCFEGIGEKKAKVLLSNIDRETLELWVTNSLSLSGFLLMGKIISETKGVGEKMWKEFSDKCQDFILWLKKNEIPVDWGQEESSSTMAGMKICFTGIRDEQLQKAILNAGGEVTNSVSKNTSFLIIDDMNSSSSKAVKARSLGIPMVTIEEFKKQTYL